MSLFFIDTEFIEAGHRHPIELLSLGMVAENGDQLYVENAEADLRNASDWVRKNVLPYLEGGAAAKTREHIKALVYDFVVDHGAKGEKPSFWGFFADYDWVVFCQIFGAMIDLPKGWPMYCNELVQLADSYRIDRKAFRKDPSMEHHALSDAVWNHDYYEFLEATHKADLVDRLGEDA